MRGKILVLIILWLTVSPGLLQAGPVELPQTGQQTCWNDKGQELTCSTNGQGQDGDLKMGADWSAPRFTDNGQTITDNLTGLMWTEAANAPGPASACGINALKTWQEALNHLKCINENSYLGYRDWRLPNVNELESLANYEVLYEGDSDRILSLSRWLESQGFTDVKQSIYWSSSSVVGYPGYAWAINMYAGYLLSFQKSSPYYVWPVRTASAVYNKGDINGDKWVDLTDVVLSLQVLVRMSGVGVRSDYPASGADVSGNGKIGLEEIIYILQEVSEIREIP